MIIEWYVETDWGDAVVAALKALGVVVSDQRPPVVAEPEVPPPLQQACRVLYIMPQAPLEVALASYKALARMRHPDVGGSTEAMQELNNAIETFKAFTEVLA